MFSSIDNEMTDVALKEEANKKAFEKFVKESSSSSAVETVQVSERYESQFLITFLYAHRVCKVCNSEFWHSIIFHGKLRKCNTGYRLTVMCQSNSIHFLPARRIALAGNSHRIVSVWLSVWMSVTAGIV